MSSLASRGRSRGFSLLEVMVSVIVICVGLLGIAKLQALALSNTTTSRLRALAAIQAASIASAMHSNRQYWGATPPNTVTVTATAITSSDAALQTQATTDLTGTSPTAPSTACVGTVGSGAACTAVQLAAFDLARWSVWLAALLPQPTATLSCPPTPGGGPANCTVQITWVEQAVSINQQEAAATVNQGNPTTCSQSANPTLFECPSYMLFVQP
jgi:type IV pilus assembly protein PilV